MAIKHPEIASLIDKALTEEGTRIVQLYSDIKTIGMKCGLLYKRKVKSCFVGVHRHNRDGAMVSGREAMSIWDDIDRIGVAPELYQDATAFEEPYDKQNEKAFLTRCAADPHLRAYAQGEVQISSVACSHWNQAIAAAEAGLAYIYTALHAHHFLWKLSQHVFHAF